MTDVANAGTPDAGEGTPETKWTDGLSEENRGLVDVKQWGDMNAVMDSYRAAEKHIGSPPEQLLKLPVDPQSEDWNSVYSRLGRPESADKYDLTLPENHNDTFVNSAKDAFFNAGLSGKQSQAMVDFYNEQSASQTEAMNARFEEQSQLELNELKSRWGNNFDKRVEAGRRAAMEFDVDEETMQSMESAMGTAKLIEMFSNIGDKLLEDNFEQGDSPASGATPEGAKEQINQLRMDEKFMKAYMTPGPGHDEAVKRMNALHQLAYV